MDDIKHNGGEHGNACGNCCQVSGKMSGCGGTHKFFLLRIVILLAILAFVFSIGVKVGEFKALFRGYGMMGGGYGDFSGRKTMMYRTDGFPTDGTYGWGMMGIRSQSTTTGR